MDRPTLQGGPNLPRLLLAIGSLALGAAPARASQIVDATGRTVELPDHIARVLPAGPPAAVLLLALAPDMVIAWPHQPSEPARAFLPDPVASLPAAPKIADGDNAVAALHPDLILDYGDVSQKFVQAAEDTQRRTGTPDILLDGHLDRVPAALRALGAVLHRDARAEVLARVAESLLALARPTEGPIRVVYARGADGLTVVAPGTGAAEVLVRLGWTVLAPEGNGTFRKAKFEDIAKLDPDWLVFSDPAMRGAVAAEPWASLRAVQAHHVLFAPTLPFGWIDEPPSINRLIGLAWLGGADGPTVAALFNAAVYGRVLSAAQIDSFRDSGQPPAVTR